MDELDEELTEPPPPPDASVRESPSKGKRPGRWRSVSTLEQFWELMAFRQECSSGRLVGFLWGVFTPLRPESPTQDPLDPPPPSLPPSPAHQPQRPEKSTHYFWPLETRGTVVLPQKHYDRVNRLLLHLDYATLDIAVESTKRWVEDVGICAGRLEEGWGIEVVGEMEVSVEGGGVEGKGENGGVHVLGMGMVRKKKKKKRGTDDDEETRDEADGGGTGAGVQVLSAGLLRKKPKVN